MPLNSRLTTMTPLDMGSMPQIHSKQPQEVMGSSRMEYRVTVSTAPWVASKMALSTVAKRPVRSSVQPSFIMGWQGPLGSSSLVALASSQDTAPHRPRRSGVTTQQWAGAKDWHRMQV